MRPLAIGAIVCGAIVVAVAGFADHAMAVEGTAGQSSRGATLRLTATIPLPHVSGRIDHLTFDPVTSRLFIAALENDTVEVIDTLKGAHLRSVAGFHEPQGMAAVPDLKGVAVANGDSGTLQMLDGDTLSVRWTSNIGGDADNVRYDADHELLYVACEGGLAAVNPSSGAVVRRIPIAGHPESFQLQRNGSLMFANLPDASQVIVADREAAAVRNRWSTGACRANYPMALDDSTNRVIVGCRRPATVTIFDAGTGKVVSSTATVGDTDDLFYDAARKRIYVIGGEGYVDVLDRTADQLKRVERLATRSGARTGLWVADQSRLYVAVRARIGQTAEVRVFEPPH